MNLLLLEDADFVGGERVRLSGRRLKHLHDVHRAETGDRLRVGHLGGLMGEGRLIARCGSRTGWSGRLGRRRGHGG